jgi:hypothetical protein
MGTEVLGSLKYAVENLGGSLKLIAVLGHSGCGALTTAVEVFLNPGDYPPLATKHSLRNILDRLLLVVQTSARKLLASFGPGVVLRPENPLSGSLAQEPHPYARLIPTWRSDPGGPTMKLSLLDRPPRGWFALDVIKDTRKWDWVALMVDVDPAQLRLRFPGAVLCSSSRLSPRGSAGATVLG